MPLILVFLFPLLGLYQWRVILIHCQFDKGPSVKLAIAWHCFFQQHHIQGCFLDCYLILFLYPYSIDSRLSLFILNSQLVMKITSSGRIIEACQGKAIGSGETAQTRVYWGNCGAGVGSLGDRRGLVGNDQNPSRLLKGQESVRGACKKASTPPLAAVRCPLSREGIGLRLGPSNPLCVPQHEGSEPPPTPVRDRRTPPLSDAQPSSGDRAMAFGTRTGCPFLRGFIGIFPSPYLEQWFLGVLLVSVGYISDLLLQTVSPPPSLLLLSLLLDMIFQEELNFNRGCKLVGLSPIVGYTIFSADIIYVFMVFWIKTGGGQVLDIIPGAFLSFEGCMQVLICVKRTSFGRCGRAVMMEQGLGAAWRVDGMILQIIWSSRVI